MKLKKIDIYNTTCMPLNYIIENMEKNHRYTKSSLHFSLQLKNN